MRPPQSHRSAVRIATHHCQEQHMAKESPAQRAAHRKPLSRFRRAVYTASAFLILALIFAVPVAFDQWNIRWAAPLAVFLLVSALLTLNLRSSTAARLFQHLKLDLIVPSLREVIEHHNQLERCRFIVGSMENTLTFYNLWENLVLTPSPAQEDVPPRRRRKLWARLAALRERLRWKRLTELFESDPHTRAPALPHDLAESLLDAESEDPADKTEARIARCAGEVARLVDLGRTDKRVLRVREELPEEQTATAMEAAERQVWQRLFESLYHERRSSDDRTWQAKVEHKGFIPGLAAVLDGSRRLPTKETDLPYQAQHLERLLRNLSRFQLEQLVDSLTSYQRQRRESLTLVKRMTYALDFYNLCPPLRPANSELVEDFELIDALLDADGEDAQIERCARELADRIDLSASDERVARVRSSVKAKRQTWAHLLELLYREYFKQARPDMWRRTQTRLVPGLAAILSESQRLPLKKEREGIAYSQSELEEFLGKLPEFTLDRVKTEILVDQRRRQESLSVVKNMEHALFFYSLCDLVEETRRRPDADGCVMTDECRDDAVDLLIRSDDQDERIARCAKKVAEYLDLDLPDERVERVRGSIEGASREAERRTWACLLELLYRDYLKRLTAPLWARSRDQLIPGLATILDMSGQLPGKEDQDLPYQVHHIERILRDLPEFTRDRFIDRLTAYQTQRRENRSVLGMMETTLDYYHLSPFLEEGLTAAEENERLVLHPTFRHKLIDELPAADSEEKRIQNCAEEVARHLRGFNPPVSGELLVLLYRTRYESQAELLKLWDQKRNLIPGLAAVLLGSGRVSRSDFPCQVEDLARLLHNLEEFSLRQIRAEMEMLYLIWRRTTGYLAFLEQNGVRPAGEDGWRPTVGQMLTCIEELDALPVDEATLPRLDEATPGVLTWAGETAIRRVFPDTTLAGTLPAIYEAEEAAIHRAFPGIGLVSKEPLLEQLGAGALGERFHSVEASPTPPILLPEERATVRKLLPDFESVWNLQLVYQVGVVAVRDAFSGLVPELPILSQVDVEAIRERFPGLQVRKLPQLTEEEETTIYNVFPNLESLFALLVFVAVGAALVQRAFDGLDARSPTPILTQLGSSRVQSAIGDLQAASALPLLGGVELDAKRRAFSDLEAISPGPIIDQQGADEIRTALPGELASLPRSLCLVSLAMFLCRDPTPEGRALRKKICFQAADTDQAVRIVFAYIEFNQDLEREGQIEGQAAVQVDYLIKSWAWRVREKQESLKQGFEKELGAVRKSLRQDDWLEHLQTLIDRTYTAIAEENKQLVRQVEQLTAQRASIRDLLKDLFTRLTIPTVERYLEARKRVAYLITFRVQRGAVATLLDLFVSPRRKNRLAAIGVELEIGGQPKYNFLQYTNSARIGVVPEGWSFEQFHEALQKDLRVVVAARRQLVPEWAWNVSDLKDIEVIVHRFGLSARNHYGFQYDDLTQPRAMQNIRKLFSDLLSPAELLTLIEYEGEEDIVNAIKDGPISILVCDKVKLNDRERNALDRHEAELKYRLAAHLGSASVQELGQVLLRGRLQRRKAWNRLAVLLEREVPEFEDREQRCKKIAQAYIDTLAVIAAIGIN
jgi:hypothetical protein